MPRPATRIELPDFGLDRYSEALREHVETCFAEWRRVNAPDMPYEVGAVVLSDFVEVTIYIAGPGRQADVRAWAVELLAELKAEGHRVHMRVATWTP
jgi:hypothetical protein